MVDEPPRRSTTRRARVLVADDHEVFRRGIQAVLEAAGHDVCGMASTGREAVDLAARLKPDLVVLDLSMPDLNGLEATRRIRASVERCEVLVLTVNQASQTVREVLAAGARGYILKSDLAHDLVAAVDALLQRRSYLSPVVSEVVLSGFLSGPPGDEARPLPTLTPREREVVQLIAEGHSTKQIAGKLAISVKTVETHRANVLRNLGLHSVGEIVRYAIRNGLAEA